MSLDYGAAVSQKGYDVKTCADRYLVYSSAFPLLKIFSSSSLTGTVPSGASAEFTADASNNYLTSVGHGLNNGDQLNFLTDGTLPGGLTQLEYAEPWSGELYYVINRTANAFQVSLTSGGGAVDITSSGSGIHTWYADTMKVIYTHNLGYYAPFMCVYNGSTTIGVSSSYLMSDSAGIPLAIRQYTNKTEIYVFGIDDFNSNPGDTVYFTLHQFLDTFDSLSALTINTGVSSGASSTDYGMRISKPGFDVKTCADIDCVLSSSRFTQIIHMKGTANGSVSSITITHSLGYIPGFLSYIRFSGRSFLSIANNYTSINSTSLNTYPNVGDVFYYLIFKSKSI